MRDHREGQDPTPVDITDRVREVRERIPSMPGSVRRVVRSEMTVRRKRTAVPARPAARGKAAKLLRSQR